MTITSPFNAQSTATEVIAGHDLSGKTALVTGASAGLGVETVRALLTAGAEVILAVRDSAKGEQVAQELRASTENPRAHARPWLAGLCTPGSGAVSRALVQPGSAHQ